MYGHRAPVTQTAPWSWTPHSASAGETPASRSCMGTGHPSLRQRPGHGRRTLRLPVRRQRAVHVWAQGTRHSDSALVMDAALCVCRWDASEPFMYGHRAPVTQTAPWSWTPHSASAGETPANRSCMRTGHPSLRQRPGHGRRTLRLPVRRQRAVHVWAQGTRHSDSALVMDAALCVCR